MSKLNSKLKVEKTSGPTGTSVFVLGLILATFFGGAFRTFFSSQQIEQFIQKQLAENNPKFELKFDSAQLSLSNGWIPRLGLLLEGVEIFAKDVCDSPFRLNIDNVYVPMYIMKLLTNELQFSTIEFGEVLLSQRESFCEKASQSHSVSVKKSPSILPAEVIKNPVHKIDVFVEKYFNFINTRWSQELANTRQWIDGVYIKKLTLKNLGMKSREHFFEDVIINMKHEESPAVLSFVFTPDSKAVYHQPIQKVKVSAQIEEELIRWSGDSGYKEGQLVFSGNFLLASGQFEVRSHLKNVPVAAIFQGFAQKKILPNIEGSRPIWMNCQQIFKGQLGEWRQAEVDLKNCQISGELGSIQASEVRIFPFQHPLASSAFELNLYRFSMKNLLDAFGKNPEINWIHQMGLVSGKILVENLKKMHFSGKVMGPSFRFSLNGEKEYQKAEYLKGDLLFSDDRFSGKISEGKINGGEFDGELSFNFDRKFRDGVFQASFQKLLFQPAVLDLLQLEGINHFEVYGQGIVKKGALHTWNGSFGFPKLSTEDLFIRKAKFKAKWKNHVWGGRFSLEKVDVKQNHPLFEILHPLYLEERGAKDTIQLTNLESQIDIDGNAFRWSRGKAWDILKNVVFASAGQFNSQGQLQGKIIVDFPVLKLLQWNIEGSFERPRLSPSARMLKELAKKKPEMPAPDSVELGGNQFFLPKAFQKESMSGLKKIRDKVFDSAKKLLPQIKSKSKEPEKKNTP